MGTVLGTIGCVIQINISDVSFKEAQAGRSPTRTRKALSYIFTLTDLTISPNDPLYRKIETTLFPQGTQNENQRNDVKIAYEASHYAAILLTHDGESRRQPRGILGIRHKLRDIVRALSDTEAIAFIRKEIQERDQFNREVVRQFGGELPVWTDND